MSTYSLSHLQELEAESIHIFREVAAEFEKPVLMYSIGKDSSVLLHLAKKAFAPGKIPFPVLHIDTKWKFKEMIAFRDAIAKKDGFELIVHTNQDAVEKGINPFEHGNYTDELKTVALKQALSAGGFDAAFGGARRDEEKSRAKERVYSFRDKMHQWDPRNQRPELWNVYNGFIDRVQGESIRVFPLSNWTELDVWQYIAKENIPVVPLYFAKKRPVVRRKGTLIMKDDDRLVLEDGEELEEAVVRFRTLGCYPLTGAIESTAETVEGIIEEMLTTNYSERQGRLIDSNEYGSMEDKKKEGYF